MSFEFVVGVMLVYLGFSTVFAFKRGKETAGTDHAHPTISYFKSMMIGFIHGLAGSAAMVILTMSTVSTVGEGALYILVFGIGTCVGMLLFTTVLGVSILASSKRFNLNKSITKCTGIISILFGMYYMYTLAVTEGLFKLWMR